MKIIEASASLENASSIIDMIKELLIFENYPMKDMANTPEKLREDLEKGHVYGYLAIDDSDKPIGYLLYYYAYSTWKGRFMFMEDLYVKEEHRRKGVGTTLWKQLAQKAMADHIPRIQWNVLNWNKKAISFYEKMGAINLSETEGWLEYRLDPAGIQKLGTYQKSN